MHPSAMANGKIFFDNYSHIFSSEEITTVLDIGSQDINGSLKGVCPAHFNYIGVDFQEGNNVDVILDDPYKLPFADNSVDIVLSSSCFEHSAMFWLVFLEILRVLKPKGLFYLNAPSRGNVHRFPVDCWRFFPDAGLALGVWGKRNNFNCVVSESYIQKFGWQDFVCVFLKDEKYIDKLTKRILDSKTDVENGYVFRPGV